MYETEMCGQAWSLTGTTGTMAALFAQDAVAFAIGATADASLSAQPNAPRRAPIEIEGFRMTFTAIVAATTPVTAGRRLQLFKSSDNAQAVPTGGTALTARPKRTLDAGAASSSHLSVARISTTAGLTLTGFTRDTVPLATFDLTGLGAAGARADFELFELVGGAALWLDPGEILVVSAPQAFDAALTWQLTVNVDYRARDQR